MLMPVIRRLAVLLALFLILAAAASCTWGEPSASEQPSPLPSASEQPPPLIYDDAPVYNVPVKNIEDTDFLLENIEIPSQVSPYELNGSIFYNSAGMYFLVDNTYALMSKGRANSENSWPGPHDVAYYNFRTDEWETPLNHGEDIYIYPVYADETHSVAATHGDPSGYPSAIVKGTLVFLDREAGAVTTIFRYPPISEGSIFTGFHLNNITILDGQIYFDDFTVYSFDGSGGSDTDSTLYAYDIESGALRVVREHAMNPIVYKDEVWFFTPDKDGSYTLLQSESGGQPLKNHHEIGALASSQGRLFTTRGMGEDAALGTSLTGVFEWGGGTAIAESRKGNVIYGLQGNQDFLVWQTSMPNQPPCVYDIAEDTLYEFTDYERCEYTFYLGGRAGLIHIREIDASGAETGNEVYRLFQKP